MVEGARLESVYTETYRGFESLPHRQLNNKESIKTITYNNINPPNLTLVHINVH